MTSVGPAAPAFGEVRQADERHADGVAAPTELSRLARPPDPAPAGPPPAIWIPCEGSGCPPNATFNSGAVGMCPMCGKLADLDAARRIGDHERQDILAMIARGDFG